MTNTLAWYEDLDPLEKQELLDGFVNDNKSNWYAFLLDPKSPSRLTLHIGCPEGFAVLMKSKTDVVYCTRCGGTFAEDAAEDFIEEWFATLDSVAKGVAFDNFTKLYHNEWLEFLKYNKKAAEEDTL